MCQFQQLYFSDDGYVVRCKKCDHFQVGFASTMLTVNEKDFDILLAIVKKKLNTEIQTNQLVKSIIIPTPYTGVKILLTQQELQKLHAMLENADSEIKALALLDLFE
ncbi:DUF6686 family protein [Ferruginibacter albus]|uniref:DUF6686 family protein n=1 Tax=Ferruginibacter albus TaxID=2875540 RepID=UPI001CC37E09|nr:DUF6686 family protein [Ferruginibacter albus]UAY52487.1 hypothetical protein K9M53_02065 [Ferruginibacter albus]